MNCAGERSLEGVFSMRKFNISMLVVTLGVALLICLIAP